MNPSLLEEALEAWADARQGVIAEADNIPAEHFDFRPTPEVRSVTGQLQHILEVAEMMVGELTRPDTNFRRVPWEELLEMYGGSVRRLTGKETLLSALHDRLAVGVERFRAAGELHMLQLIERFDGNPGTRFAWFQHGIAQEEYHRAQLALYARLLGLEPALTRMIRLGANPDDSAD